MLDVEVVGIVEGDARDRGGGGGELGGHVVVFNLLNQCAGGLVELGVARRWDLRLL